PSSNPKGSPRGDPGGNGPRRRQPSKTPRGGQQCLKYSPSNNRQRRTGLGNRSHSNVIRFLGSLIAYKCLGTFTP
uniref:Uncharacterized protein n=1 Tax=Athene cunicularia TaxID=194338 RepID=A0A663M087_ATHCN